MKYPLKFPKNIALIFSLFILISCAESLDFKQIEAYTLKPVFTTALVSFKAKPIQFFDSSGTIQKNSVSDVFEFKGFDENYLRNNVVKLIFNAEFKNEFDRDVTIQVDFLNRNNIIIYSFSPIFVESFDVNPAPYEEEIIIADNLQVLNATQVKITASLENTTTQLNPTDTSEFDFKSSVTLFIESEF
ncbi:hypothetical protein LPB03_15340 [Polaribacter vadi]|uniref:Lipoprotein n=1 Tax=Polaribacter vadi TaxID=1774273 RepID=A0A1B8TQQ4_9FLAO|nr:hypothetical protein LPB03_15340 [Polaribacter vadi]OBY61895.1 hypothetical protein LPB3_13965 [Polaribacter vadi]